MSRFDAIIIGTGQAGVPLAKALSDKGWKVAVIEKSYVGGSCINYGCTPTKAMVASARRAFVARTSKEHGIKIKDVAIDLKTIVERKDKIIEEFRSGVERRLTHKNITLYRTAGEFVDTYKIQVGDETIEGKYIFINTGQQPSIPKIEGLDGLEGSGGLDYLTSTTILDLKELPSHLIVLGGGYVGLEFAQMFRRFGSKVTIIQRGERLASQEDPDISEDIKKILENEQVKVLLKTSVVSVKKKGRAILLELEHSGKRKMINGSQLLVATGRRPNTDDLDLEKTGIEHDQNGYINVNEKLETNVKNVYALGDIRGGPAFTHTSYNDYEIVYSNIVERKNLTIYDRVLVYAIFTDPSLGRAGMTEREAREKGFDVAVSEYPLSWVARAIELGETQGKMKLVVDKKTEKILGASILGYEGAEIIHVISAYMNEGASYKTVQRAITIHPTVAEGIQSLALALK